MVQEVEIKALLTEKQYNDLRDSLPKTCKTINQDEITTFRFRPKDIRVRWSNKIQELVYKDGDPTSFSRKEITVNLAQKQDCESMLALLRELGFKDDPSWLKRKDEFVVHYKGHEYTLSLQFIQNFAYILEAEIMTDHCIDEHTQNLKEILKNLGCQLIEPEEFTAKIQEYIKKNGVI